MNAHIKKEFKCVCGKIFQNSQSFNGHKSHCKSHLIAKGGIDRYNQYIEKQRYASDEARKIHEVNVSERKQKEISDWLSAGHICERCGKLMTIKFGSGRFCSQLCASSRVHSEETKQKIRETLNHTLKAKEDKTIRPVKYCTSCNKRIKNYNKTGFCRSCLISTDEGKLALSESGKNGYQTKLENGTHKGWQSRNVISYAEQFWIDVLKNNHISYEREVPVKHDNSNYFLDFVIEHSGKLIDLEIDGKQHTYEDRKASDIARDLYLTKLGYIVYRVAWNEITSDEGKQEMKAKIDTFLAFIAN